MEWWFTADQHFDYVNGRRRPENEMKCKIKYVEVERHQEAAAIVEVKLHRHTIEITGLEEIDAIELEELLNKTKKIKVRRYNDVKDSKKVCSG